MGFFLYIKINSVKYKYTYELQQSDPILKLQTLYILISLLTQSVVPEKRRNQNVSTVFMSNNIKIILIVANGNEKQKWFGREIDNVYISKYCCIVLHTEPYIYISNSRTNFFLRSVPYKTYITLEMRSTSSNSFCSCTIEETPISY